MAYKLNLAQIDENHSTITGAELAIEDKESGTVYVTTKPYIDKLFKLMGYKGLRVVKILEEYTGRTISSVGDIKDCKIFVDDTTQTFIVTNPQSVIWVNKLLEFLKDNNYTIDGRRYDACYNWDQLIITNPKGCKFAIYIDLCGEEVRVLSLSYDDKDVLVGMIDEGKYSTLEGESSLVSLVSLISGQVDISSEFKLDQKLSLYEYVNLLRSLGYVSKKKKKFYKNDTAEEIIQYVGDLDYILDEYNLSSWINQRIKESPNGATFKDACILISLNLDNIFCWSFRDFYMNNARELSDLMALNQ